MDMNQDEISHYYYIIVASVVGVSSWSLEPPLRFLCTPVCTQIRDPERRVAKVPPKYSFASFHIYPLCAALLAASWPHSESGRRGRSSSVCAHCCSSSGVGCDTTVVSL